MAATVTVREFEGPLELLLQLIDSEKMSITDVSLVEVTDQFIRYLDTLSDQADELASFLVVASKLLYLKSRSLLPFLQPDEAEDGTDLAAQLRLYQRFIEASAQVKALWDRHSVSYARVQPPRAVTEFRLPGGARGADLQAAMLILLKRLTPVTPLPELALAKTVSVHEKIQSIYEILKKVGTMRLAEMAAGRSEVIVTFLAILELVKEQRVAVKQAGAFADLSVHSV